MIRIIDEGTIHRQDQIDIMIEALYSKFRRYDYIIDTLIEEANKMTKDDDISKWRDNFCLICAPAKRDVIISQILPVFCEEEGIPTEKNYHVGGGGWRGPSVEKIEEILNKILHFVWWDNDLNTDMFYSDSSQEADINNNDWADVQKLIKSIYAYTRSYQTGFSKEDAELLIKHMSKKNFPLYRIEPYENSYYKLKGLNIGSVFNLDFERTNGIKSFTSNMNSKSMQMMKRHRTKETGTNFCVIYETVGSVYSLDIDAISGYAQYATGRSGQSEYEHLVSGNFEVVDIDSTNGIVWIKIKQLSKNEGTENIATGEQIQSVSPDDFAGATLLTADEVEKYVSMDKRCVVETPSNIKTKKGIKEFQNSHFLWILRGRGDEQRYNKGHYCPCIVRRTDGAVIKDLNPSVGINIRPVLILNSDKFNVGDTFSFNGFNFDVISPDLALCTTFIGSRLEYGYVEYEQSCFKEKVDRWYDCLINGKEWNTFLY